MCSVIGTEKNDYVNIANLKNRLFSTVSENTVSRCIKLNGFLCLGHLVRMTDSRLPYRIVFSIPSTELEKPDGSQQIT